MQSRNHNLPAIQELDQYLTGFVQDGCEFWQKENDQYLKAHMRRFHATLGAIPEGKPGEKLLELGASPYFMSLALHHYSNYTIYLSDGVNNEHTEQLTVKLINAASKEEHEFECQFFNVEIDTFPYPDNSFNFVLCSELIEHLALDPTHMLYEIHRILVPGGKLLVTTPNVLVLRNLVSLIKHKRNIYFPYSGYGVYGRHNREWTLEELVQLMEGCGFAINTAQIVDTYPHRGYSKVLKSFFSFLRDMLVVTGQAENEPVHYYPENLYESYPRQFSPMNPIPSNLQVKSQDKNEGLLEIEYD